MLQKVSRPTALVGLAALVVVAGCGGSSGDDSGSSSTGSQTTSLGTVSLMTGAKNIIAPDLPFVVAKEKGYYEEVGLDVDIKFGDGYETALRVTGSGQAQYAEADLASITSAVDATLPVQSVAIYSQTNPAGLVFRNSNPIRSPEDLRRKKIAVSAGSGSGKIFDAWLAANSLTDKDFTRVVVPGHQKPIVFAQNQVDAYVGLGYDDLPDAKKTGGADEISFYYFGQDNIRVPGVAIAAATSEIKDNPDRVKAFLAATKKGYEDAVSDVPAAVELAQRLQPTTDPQLLTAQWEIFIGADKGTSVGAWGTQLEESWQQTIEVFGNSNSPLALNSYYTDAYLPSE